MLGSEVLKQARERGHDVYAPNRVELPIEVPLFPLNVWLRKSGWITDPDVIINCSGLIPCRGPFAVRTMLLANGAGPHHLASLGIRLIHMSTDCVFSGSIGSNYCYSVEDNPNPIDLYGRSKLVGEPAGENVLVVRGSFIGFRHGFLKWLLESQKKVQAYMIARWNGAAAWHMATALLDLAEGNRTGIVHVAAEEAVTKAWMIEYLAEALNLPVDIEVVAEPHINHALCPDVLLPPVKQSLEEIVEQVREQKRE